MDVGQSPKSLHVLIEEPLLLVRILQAWWMNFVSGQLPRALIRGDLNNFDSWLASGVPHWHHPHAHASSRLLRSRLDVYKANQIVETLSEACSSASWAKSFCKLVESRALSKDSVDEVSDLESSGHQGVLLSNASSTGFLRNP